LLSLKYEHVTLNINFLQLSSLILLINTPSIHLSLMKNLPCTYMDFVSLIRLTRFRSCLKIFIWGWQAIMFWLERKHFFFKVTSTNKQITSWLLFFISKEYYDQMLGHSFKTSSIVTLISDQNNGTYPLVTLFIVEECSQGKKGTQNFVAILFSIVMNKSLVIIISRLGWTNLFTHCWVSYMTDNGSVNTNTIF
jgi:hypothetical protein